SHRRRPRLSTVGPGDRPGGAGAPEGDPDPGPLRRPSPPPTGGPWRIGLMGAPPLTFTTVSWQGDRVVLLDQRRLPAEEHYLECRSWQDVAEAIRTLAVRGAPAIGVAAAGGVALAALESRAPTGPELLAALEPAIEGLARTRPTAVNLFWALERMRRVARERAGRPVEEMRAQLVAEAGAMLAEDIAAHRRIGGS